MVDERGQLAIGKEHVGAEARADLGFELVALVALRAARELPRQVIERLRLDGLAHVLARLVDQPACLVALATARLVVDAALRGGPLDQPGQRGEQRRERRAGLRDHAEDRLGVLELDGARVALAGDAAPALGDADRAVQAHGRRGLARAGERGHGTPRITTTQTHAATTSAIST